EHRATLFMTLLAAFQVLLGRAGGQTDLAVGTVIANRNRAEIEGLLGFFVNTLVLRGDLGGDPAFRELLGRARETALGAYAHQDVPFEKLVAELDPERDLSRNPLVQVTLVLQNIPMPMRELAPGLAMEVAGVAVAEAKFDLGLNVAEGEEGLIGPLVYKTDLFDRTTILRLLGAWRILLDAVVSDPEKRLSELPLVSAAERQQLLREWNDTALPWSDPPAATLHQLVEVQVEATPEAIAVEFADQRLSYLELNRRANDLAHHLRSLGVGPEVRVGICVERSSELVVGLLGILKSGGAYLPLDPAYPPERLSFMAKAAGVRVLLIQERLLPILPEPTCPVVCLDRDGVEISAQSAALPIPAADPSNLAYVIYTSGSTGEPKGSMNPHRGIVNRIPGMQAKYRRKAGAGGIQKPPFSFDVSVWETFWPLVSGGRLVVARPGGHRESAYLAELVATRGVTAVQFVPAMLELYVEELERMDDPQATGALGRVFASGEALPYALQERFFARFSGLGVALSNLYGPTETSVGVTFWSCEREDRRRTVPIGRPMSNIRIHLLDRCGAPASIGVTGELAIGGAGVGRGYLGRTDLTAERFIPDPFSGDPFGPEPGSRLYRSGDLARQRPDGAIEYLGRTDHQVKIRGLRIELGEIEAAVGRSPRVRECVVVARDEIPGDRRRLVAYLVAEGEAPEQELRASLRESLPEYMVPAAMVVLDALPRTPTGKVDRRRLPAPEPAAYERAGTGAAPRDPIEEILAEIYSQLLGVDRVGVGDDFFALGGHSLLATQLASRVRRMLGVELPLRIVFEQSTVAGLAASVRALLRREEDLKAPPIRRAVLDEASRNAIPLSFAQQRLWFLDRLDPGSALYNIPTALRLDGRLDVAALRLAFAEIVRRHEVLRTRYPEMDGEPIQSAQPEPELPVPVVDLRAVDEPRRRAEARRLVRAQARRPFDLARGPVLRAALLQLRAQAHTLILAVHHIAFDGWSGRVFLRELSVLYQALCAGRSVHLPDLPVQYADFAVWQRQWLRGEVLERQLAYWREQLAGLPVLDLPCDRPRPAVQSSRGTSERLRLPAALGGRLQELSREQGTTLFMTLLAAFQALLGRITGQPDLAVGTAIANRNHAELEGLVGFFVNTLVLRGDLRGNSTVRELLARTRDVALGAYAHQDVPFEQLVDELEPERDLSHSPLVQVFFVLQNLPAASWNLGPELKVEVEGVATGVAKFDLTLSLIAGEAGLSGALGYNTDLFDASTIRRMAGHLRTLLEGVIADPECRVSALPLLTGVETHQLLCEWSAGAGGDRGAGRVSELFEAQAARRPEAIAVVSRRRHLSYGELNARANQLAARLRCLGVGADVIVGLFLEGTPEAMVAILGVLKAGGAYLPLDPAYPGERLAFMIEDSRVPVVLTREGLAAELPPHRAEVVRLDADWPAIAAGSRENAAIVAAPANLAYAIYTSGSTGLPKGVLVAQRGVCEMAEALAERYEVTPASRVLLWASLSFDAAAAEIFTTLLAGGTLCLGEGDELMPGPDLVRTLRAQAVTNLTLVPSALQAMPVEELPALRSLVVAGEASSGELVALWQRHRRMVNAYGPTEATVCTTAARIVPAAAAGEKPPIGRPVAASRIRVLDRGLAPVPIGVPGELLIGGVGVARGYLGRPALTAERFVPDPLSGDPWSEGERLYRSGDLVRLLHDGQLEFLGRIDQQVKLRGFRIELGEVESALGRHPAVREAVAIVRDQRLVASVVPSGEAAEIEAAVLRFEVGKTLPEYMVPAAVMVLDALPRTPSGKVDRAALGRRTLPAPEVAGGAGAGTWTGPRGPIEEIVAEIFSQVLEVERVGAGDDFFALGGHSLLATQVVSRVRRTLGIELPLRVVFEHSTVAGLAACVSAALRREEGVEAPPIRPAARRDVPAARRDVPLSFAQQRLWVLDRLDPGSTLYNISTALRLTGRLKAAALGRALDEIVRRHEVLRTRFEAIDDEPVQVIQ
ncbi:MAG: amino acid adenylation domain-containing protein, partial [bacterium]|nr:amino acid adenylation domain-containing protein [bacterium]